MRKTTLTLLLLLPLTACGGGKPDNGQEPPADASESHAFLDGFYRPEAPADAIEVLGLREDLEDGAEVVVTGRVKDFVEGISSLVLTDESLEWCGKTHDDQCVTPWDYCCVDAGEVSNASATVELHQPGGGLGTHGLKGWKDLDHLDKLVVAGTLHKDGAGNVSIHARSLSIAE